MSDSVISIDEPAAAMSQFSLLRTKRFWPLFVVQFEGAFLDNLLKTFFVVMIAYGMVDIGAWEAKTLVAAAAGVFILPFVLLCPFAGNLADKYDKARLIRINKAVELGVAVLGVLAIYTTSLELAFAVLVLLGVQSAFFSPCKFGILPQHLKANELIAGNGLVSMGTYIAILLGTILGAVLVPMDGGKLIAAVIAIGGSLAAFFCARIIPAADAPRPDLYLSFNIFAKAFEALQFIFAQSQVVRIAVAGIGFFYFVAATFHSQFAVFAAQTLRVDTIVLMMFMVVFSVGVAVGGMLNHKVLKSRVDGRYVPISCLFMAIFGIDLYFAAGAFAEGVVLNGGAADRAPGAEVEADIGLAMFVSNLQGLRLFFDTFMQATAAGFFVIPLRALVQRHADAECRARVLSGSNLVDSVFILLSSVFAALVLGGGFMVEELYLIVSFMTLLVGVWFFYSREKLR